MVITLLPMPLRRLAQFVAYDPGANNIATQFDLVEYVMMPEGSAQAVASSNYGHRVGIRSAHNGAVTMIPQSLFDLWKQGQIPAERIPALAHAIKPRIIQEDYNLLTAESAKSLMIGVVGAFVLIGVIVGLAVKLDLVGRIEAGIAAGAGTILLIGPVFWLIRFSQRSRRRNQMNWLLQANAGIPAKLPEGRGAGKVKLWLLLMGWMAFAMAALLGGVWWFVEGGGKGTFASHSPAPSPSNSVASTETTVSLTEAEAATGKVVTLISAATNERITVRIPAGIRNGTRLRVRGQGKASPDGVPGDLLILVLVR